MTRDSRGPSLHNAVRSTDQRLRDTCCHWERLHNPYHIQDLQRIRLLGIGGTQILTALRGLGASKCPATQCLPAPTQAPPRMVDSVSHQGLHRNKFYLHARGFGTNLLWQTELSLPVCRSSELPSYVLDSRARARQRSSAIAAKKGRKAL